MEKPSSNGTDLVESPSRLHWDFTHRCNLRCKYCHKKSIPLILYESANSALKEEVSIRLIRNVVKELADMNTKLDITGGEPFLNKNIYELIQLSVSHNLEFDVITKRCFSEREVSRLKEIGLRKITVSIDSPVTEKADFLVGKDNFLSDMLNSLKYLNRAGIEVRVMSLICNYTIKEFDEFIKLLDDLGVKAVLLQEFNPANFSFSKKYNHEVLQYEDILSLSDYNRRLIKDLVHDLPQRKVEVRDLIKAPGSLAEPNPCFIKQGSLFLRPDGKAMLCGQLQEFVVGDIKEQSIAEIWNSEMLQTLMNPPRSLFKGTDCHDCHAFEECNNMSRCYGQALVKHKRLFAPDSRLCSFYKEEKALVNQSDRSY